MLSCACRPADKIPNDRDIVLQVSPGNEVAASVKSCLTAGHVEEEVLSENPTVDSSGQSAAEDSENELSHQAQQQVSELEVRSIIS